jgi:PncC family amidohydrolase
MSEGVCKALGADIGVAISGIAGPGGGSPEKPVGTVWFGVAGPQGTRTRKFQFSGDRIAVKEQAAETALQLGIDYLNGNLS